MQGFLKRYAPQPLTAVSVSALALLILTVTFLEGSLLALDAVHIQDGLVALFLGGAVIGAGIFPIHLQHNVKVVVTTAPMYVMVLLLPPTLAALIAGASMLILQLLTRSQRGNTPSDMATSASRWIISAFVSAWMAWRLTNDGWPLAAMLLIVAGTMFVCDLITSTLEIAPIMGDSPRRVLALLAREASLTEGAQYLLGVLAVLAAMQQAWSLVLWVLPLCISYRSFKYAKQMHDGTSKLLESLADAVDLRDAYTGGHSRRVTELSRHILNEMHISGPEVDLICSAARVHDIGKIGIPDQILNKPQNLSPQEKRIMDSHAERGAELLIRYRDFARGVAIVRHHHEHWDGTGYPGRLKGTDIPFGARVIAVADSFDAMTSERPYQSGITVGQAAQILYNGRAQQWDPMIVDAFLHYLAKVYKQAPPSDDLAEVEMAVSQ
jgi:HD-GYP domain-containing protein (c-di-GMP phosphodiesterase class II)